MMLNCVIAKARAAMSKAEEIRSFPLMTVEESVDGLLKEIDSGTRESIGGQFASYTGAKLNW